MNTAQNSSLDALQSQVAFLNNEVVERDGKILQLSKEINEKDHAISSLEEQLAWFKRQIFGKRSERIVGNVNSQQLLLAGFENLNAPKEEKKTVGSHTRKKPNRNGQDKINLSPDLPVQTVYLDIPEEQKVCKETGVSLVKIGEEVTHKLAQHPTTYYVKEIIRPKYANPVKEEEGIVIADLPETLLPKCRADDSLLAEIITQKFAYHLPLYRVAELMSHNGVRISRKLLSQWVIRCGEAVRPLYDEMVKYVLASENIFIDESPVKLQEAIKCKLGYMWVIVGGQGPDPAYRIYDFRENRCHDNVLDILEDYRGGLHSDKFAAYQKLAERKIITWFPCFSHIRRKFFEAESGDPAFRKWVLMKIRHLFMLERVAWARSAEERLKIRQEKEIPILDELIHKIKSRLINGKILPKSKFREALGYFCGLIPYLKNYTKHPDARLDNNVAERAIRPLTIGRKNWLFFGSPDGGESAAILLSLVQTCRGLNINPREYLEDIFRRLPSHNAQKLHELLPDQWLLNRNKKINLFS
jgi:transposase